MKVSDLENSEGDIFPHQGVPYLNGKGSWEVAGLLKEGKMKSTASQGTAVVKAVSLKSPGHISETKSVSLEGSG